VKQKIIMPPDGGVNKRLPKNLINDNSFTDVLNVRFGAGYVEKVAGWQKWNEQQLDGVVMTIENYYKFAGDDWLIAITPTTVYRYDPTGSEFISLIDTDEDLTGTTASPVLCENAQDLFIITNGVDSIKYWDGELDYITDLPGMDDCEPGPENYAVTSVKAKCFLWFNEQLILGGTTENGEVFPQRIRTSQMGDVTAWKNNADGSGECFVGDLTDGVDWIVRLLPFKNYVVVYKERSIQVLSYVGGDLVWDKWPSIDGIGLLASRAVINLGEVHLFLGNDNFYSFNFQETSKIGNDIREEFFRLLDPAKAGMTHAFLIEEKTEVWWNFVSINSVDGLHDMSIGYNYDKGTWTIAEKPFTAYGYYLLKEAVIIDELEMEIDEMDWAIDSSKHLANAPINLCGDAQGYIYLLDGNTKDGADMESYATTKTFDLGLSDYNKRWKGLNVYTTEDEELKLYVGTQTRLKDPVAWYGPYSLTNGKFFFDHTAPFATFQFIGSKYFQLIGYEVLYDVRGKA
jgi:hypothetical protein